MVRWGADLTPLIFLKNDAVHFHQVHKDVYDRHTVGNYNKFKQCVMIIFSSSIGVKEEA